MKRDLPSPAELLREARPENLAVATRMAREKLASLDPADVATRSGADLVRDRLELVYLGGPLSVRTGDWTVCHPDGTELNPYEQVLVLHYLAGTDPPPPPADPITFGEVPSGEFYSPAFDRRARIPLLRRFGMQPDEILGCAAPLGGRQIEHGDLAVSVPAFPRVEIILVFWRGDEEFPPDLKILLSSSIATFLSTEDIAHLAGLTAARILKESKK